MKALGLLFIIAVVVEALIEYFEFLFDFIEDERAKKITKQLIALVIAEIFAFQLGAVILTPFVQALGGTVSAKFDTAIAGIFCSRGANYLADIIGLIVNVGKQAKESVADDSFWDMFEFEHDDDEEEGEEDGSATEKDED